MNFMLPHKVDKIPLPYLVVCEGYGDAIFISELLKLKQITNCSVGCPSDQGGFGSGKNAIDKYLKAVQGSIKLRKAILSGLLIVADADDDEESCFANISMALRSAEFPIPGKPFSLEGSPLKTGVFIIPGAGKTGTLEHVLWDAAVQKNPKLGDCVDAFSTCTGGYIDSAAANKKAKMRMSAIVAAHCQENPWASPSMLWKQRNNPVPIDSNCFDHISAFLVDFTA